MTILPPIISWDLYTSATKGATVYETFDELGLKARGSSQSAIGGSIVIQGCSIEKCNGYIYISIHCRGIISDITELQLIVSTIYRRSQDSHC